MHRVVVTGVGVVAPNGVGRRDFCEAIFEGRSGVDFIESFDTSGQSIKIAGEVKNFDVLPFLGEYKKNLKMMSRAVRFAVGAAALAVDDSGLDTEPARPGPIRRLHGNRDHAGRRGRAGRPDHAGGRHGRGVRHGPVRHGPGRVDLPAVAACSIFPTWRRPTFRSSITRWARIIRS